MPVIGTAGHVDHGKSTLVLALTGRDPDRWVEEKRRGLTIDLGFSWMTLPSGVEVSFVDVPGHERFMKNMLAGVEGIDAALVVVAADEGWMAQSEEHLAVLDLLDVTRGVVALTKVDRIEADRIEALASEVRVKLAGTSLSRIPLVPVAAPEGAGLAELVGALSAAVGRVGVAAGDRPRLWVDRSFSLPGVGTVVTGTLTGGSVTVGQEIVVWPAEVECRVRSLQVHEQAVSVAESGRRVAVGLVGVTRREVRRGDMLGVAGQWVPTDRVLVRIRAARYIDTLPKRGAFQIHVGSGVWPARVRYLTESAALVVLGSKICLRVGDRFVLRDVGRRRVIGGGRVLDPAPSSGSRLRATAPLLEGLGEATPDERARVLLAIRGTESGKTLAAHTGGGKAVDAIEVEGIVLSRSSCGKGCRGRGGGG